MKLLIYTIFLLSFSAFLIFICRKNIILMNSNGNKHQEFVGNFQTPLIGGIIVYFSILFFNFYELNLFFIFITLIFLIGLFSDLKKLNSPNIRILIQIILTLFCVYLLKIDLSVTRINLIDFLLKNYIFALVFTSFCILIIMNGTNFIDGINSLAIGYYLLICFALLYLKSNGLNISFYFPLYFMITCLVCIFILNLFNKLFLGDAGAYLLGFIFSIELINLYLQNINISPFFIILLLWYPAFENLFSILRKINFNKSPVFPDTNHLHQLIFSFFKNKKLSQLKSNNLAGISINLYNALVIATSLTDPYNTQLQIILIILNLFVYTFFYMRLFKYR
tara:strand:- start:744 stop:1751 length:1008 start_codon:yes stop_codon:yes gene_type:complete